MSRDRAGPGAIDVARGMRWLGRGGSAPTVDLKVDGYDPDGYVGADLQVRALAASR
ncbi:hypothetical protein [Luteitalea pratensis]|uniref:hypothetical protein n=1 Tax=Luteitalea pratensis TaxID=1855912 RepID=UPI00138FE2DD|nr:hypothetical protein [Luteitalea pratensis]